MEQMRLDRHFDKNYYKHKKHKYATRTRVGGYTIVKNSKTGHKTRAYKYSYTYDKVIDHEKDALKSRNNIATYIKLRSDLAAIKSARSKIGKTHTKAILLKEEKLIHLYNQLPIQQR